VPAEQPGASRGQPAERVAEEPAVAARTEGRQFERQNPALDAILAGEDGQFRELREEMVETQIRARGVRDEAVLRAMLRVPRQLFVSDSLRSVAYADCPQRIGHGQTISQPYIVALMTELARPTPTSKALDVGTGSGYQAAILAEVCQAVYGIEIVEPLAEEAKRRLAELGYAQVTIRCGDGYRGWPEQAPFDLILVAAAPNHIPQPLVDQLAEGGRLVIPVGDYFQELMVVEKTAGGLTRQWSVAPVAFVPMTGEAQRRHPE
jgi:protein-L-isoaspartate(D-aspartate) O-methyltransferase